MLNICIICISQCSNFQQFLKCHTRIIYITLNPVGRGMFNITAAINAQYNAASSHLICVCNYLHRIHSAILFNFPFNIEENFTKINWLHITRHKKYSTKIYITTTVEFGLTGSEGTGTGCPGNPDFRLIRAIYKGKTLQETKLISCLIRISG